MKKSILACVCLMLLICCQFAAAKVGSKKKIIDGPILTIDDVIDFGEVKQNDMVEKIIKFSNSGDQELKIEEVEASCGCTAVVLSSKTLAPGESGELKIKLDTFGKKGDIKKTITIFSNDYVMPEKVIHLLTQVKAPKHPKFDVGETLFSKKCRSCHADKGKGLIGSSLYLAICHQCHGAEGEGSSSAPALSAPEYLKQVDSKYLYNWIADGKRGTSMPGYSQKHAGPLDERQLNSLVDFILRWR